MRGGMTIMNYIFKTFFLVYMIFKMSISGQVAPIDIIIILIVISSNIFKERFINSSIISVIIAIFEVVIIAFGVKHNLLFITLFAITAYDFVRIKIYFLVIFILLFGFYSLSLSRFIDFSLLIALSCFFAYVSTSLEVKEMTYKESYDKERKYRYELEQSRVKLINMSKEIAHITEVNERNRIAREIHDTVGHKIAGILLQLQASLKLRIRDDKMSNRLLKESIENLSNTLVVLRDTVHNIKPKEKVGIEYIKQIIANFSFCHVDFSFKGDFNNISAANMEIINHSIKEALTNVMRHSKADNVIINIELYDKFIRLFIKDNGVGCEKITEGLGISGMKERLNNIGGSISISTKDGFMIVAIVPRENVQGGVGVESSHS